MGGFSVGGMTSCGGKGEVAVGPTCDDVAGDVAVDVEGETK